MARLIGMDEAGLGPNLGPLVVAVTVWDVPGSPAEFNFWKTFKSVLTNRMSCDCMSRIPNKCFNLIEASLPWSGGCCPHSA